MSKMIKPTTEYLQSVLEDFKETLSSGKFSDGRITFTKTMGRIDRKAKVIFTQNAWKKMQALISEFDKEVAWHGVAHRGEDESKDEYIITDILVYPQEVTSATVTTDQGKYEMWLMSHDDDVFNNIRMQGHSHVNMGVLPSGVDNELYDRLLEQLDDTMFYIFMIWNKKNDKTVKIYDLKKNVLFDTDDVTIEQMNDEPKQSEQPLTEDERKAVAEFLTKYRDKKETESFIKSAKDMVKDRVYRPESGNKHSSAGFYDGSRYGAGYTPMYGYGSYYSQCGGNKDEKKSTQPQSNKDSGKKSDKRKGKRKKYNGYNGSSQIALFHSAYDDDDDDFYARGF